MEQAVYEQFYKLEKDHWWFAGMRTICRSLLGRLTIGTDRGRTRSLDVGCGTGLWTTELDSFGQVCGLDLAPDALEFCRRRGIQRLVQATADRLPFRSESLNLITALGLIEHLDNDTRFLSELSRVCKPGGYVLLLTSAYDFLWSQHDDIVHHKRRYTRTRFSRLLTTSGFQVLRSTYVNTLLFLPILGVRFVQRLSGVSATAQYGSPDVFMPPSLVNRFLYGLLWAEARLLNFVSFPFGVGLLAIVRKPIN